MCGIAGFLGQVSESATLDSGRALLSAMTDRIVHRGPDADGAWCDQAGGGLRVGLGHRRLSILDLSPAGSQPMASACGRFVLVFNGEIYNHNALRAELGELPWRGHSDTETLLAGFSRWGIKATLERAVGMFAIALWDKAQRCLTLMRDRLGEKPLYYGWAGGDFIFASELKALKAYPGFAGSRGDIDRNALSAYLRFSCVPAPYSIYRGVYKLEPGCLLTLQADTPPTMPTSAPTAGYVDRGLHVERWWCLKAAVAHGKQNAIHSQPEAMALLEAQLRQTIRDQSVADVPVGAFLSGGIDSSLIVALMQAEASRPVETFTVGFSEKTHDEAGFAEAVARHLGTVHHNLHVTGDQALEVITSLPRIYDEPFADSSQIPTYLICQQARRFVTVALSGDGGDEFFGGYNRYYWSRRLWQSVRHIPGPLRRGLAGLAGQLGTRSIGSLASLAMRARGAEKVSLLGDKLVKLSELIRHARTLEDFYPLLVSEWKNPDSVVLSGNEYDVLGALQFQDIEGLAEEERMMALDAMTYLPNDILVKVDRAAMAVSLETRAPFLDHRVFELAWRFPLEQKIKDGIGKRPLRQLVDQFLPRDLMDRPKQGFSIPLAEWLRGPLRDWAESLLNEETLAKDGFFNPRLIRAKWKAHLTGQADCHHALWGILMFQAWLADQ